MDEQAAEVFHDETEEVYRRIEEENEERAEDGFLAHAPSSANNPDYNNDFSDDWLKELEFASPDAEENEDVERLYEDSRRLLFGDYHYPAIDVSGEEARRKMWDDEERILSDQRAAFGSPTTPTHPSLSLLTGHGPGSMSGQGIKGYGAIGHGVDRVVHGVGHLVGRAHVQSDPDPRAARSAAERTQKGKGRTGVYGGWAERRHDGPSRSQSTTTLETHVPDISVIDYTPNEVLSPDTDPGNGAIDLRYSRATARAPAPSKNNLLGLDTTTTGSKSKSRSSSNAHSPSSSTPSPRAPSHSIPSSPLSGSPPTHKSVKQIQPELHKSKSNSSRARFDSTTSQQNSTASSPSTPTDSSALPSDAIDLVVEDTRAEEDEMTRERRKGEPAVRATGERRIYRREYFVKEEDSEGNIKGEKKVVVEHEEEPGVKRDVQQKQDAGAGKPGERSEGKAMEREEITTMGEDGEEEERVVLEVADEVPEEQIVREATPPPYTQVLFSPPPNDESNPWS